MKGLTKIWICAIVLAALPQRAVAQFYFGENDAARVKWDYVENSTFRVIYPRGCDSLAMKYIRELEKYRIPVSRSIGMTGGQYQKNRLPVILHTDNMASNGMVTWTPRRMELNTMAEWDAPTAMPWHTILAIHEGRHFAQMQEGYRGWFKPLRYILGEIVPGAAAIFPDMLILEGDAVVAETGLSGSGRGRNSLFLQYHQLALDQGDRRNWTRWKLGSYYHPTPDNYAFGYLLISGIRARYDAPLFIDKYFDYVCGSINPWCLRSMMKKSSGQSFKQTYREILDYHRDVWRMDTLARGPFMPAEQLSPSTRRISYYSSINTHPHGDSSLWVKSDMYRNTAIVRIDTTGRETQVFTQTRTMGTINYCEVDSTLIWSELRKDPRWGHKNHTYLREYHIPTGKFTTLRKDRDYVNPVAASDTTLAAIHIFQDGTQKIGLLGKRDGRLIKEWDTPDSLQIVLITVLNGDIYAAAISSGGFGIWRMRGQCWDNVLPPMQAHIDALDHDGQDLTFESDMLGTKEFYRYNVHTHKLTQLTSTRYGGMDFSLSSEGDVEWSEPALNGSHAMVTRKENLVNREVSLEDIHHYHIADKLSAQEKTLAALAASPAEAGMLPDTLAREDSVSAPRHYRKPLHAIRIHSWAPLYVNYDGIMSMSFDAIRDLASLGAMLFFQNDMSTFGGYVAYQASPAKCPIHGREWFHAGHINLTYKGLYPVFEFTAHIGEDHADNYYRYYVRREGKFVEYLARSIKDTPSLRTSLKTYVPLSWTTRRAVIGVIPSIGLSYTNNTYMGGRSLLGQASIRSYIMTPVPDACIYPRWGAGMELSVIEPLEYAYLYGYVPGICCGQGIRMTALGQKYIDDSGIFLSGYANVLPRGFASSGLRSYEGMKFTIDYTAPFYMGDWNMGDFFYCKRGIVTPFAEYTKLGAGQSLRSYGLNFSMEFGAFVWVTFPVTVGVDFALNRHSGFDSKVSSSLPKTYVGLTFNMEIPE